MSDDQDFQLRTVNVKGNIYIRKEDVVDLIENVGSTEETDVRWRLEKLVKNIQKNIK